MSASQHFWSIYGTCDITSFEWYKEDICHLELYKKHSENKMVFFFAQILKGAAKIQEVFFMAKAQ